MAIQVQLTDTFEQWRVKTNEISTVSDSLESNIVVLKGNVVNLTNSLNTTNTNVTNLQSSLNTTNANVTNLQSSLNTTNNNLTTTNNNLNTTNTNVTNLQSSLNTTNTNLSANAALLSRVQVIGIVYVIDGGTIALTPGVKGDLSIPFAARITGWSVLADTSGTTQVDIWKNTIGNYPPTVANSITSVAAKPRLNSQTSNSATNVNTWSSTDIAAGDTLRFNLDSTSTIKRLTITLNCIKL